MIKRFFALVLFGMIALTSCSEDQSVDDVVVTINNVTLSTTSHDFTVGDDPLTLTATTTPSDAEAKSIEWSVENDIPEGCVTVSDDGVVTAITQGTATIVVTVTSLDGSTVTAECAITIAAAPAVVVEADSIVISKTTLLFDLSSDYISEQLTATVYPEDATYQDFTYSIMAGSDDCIDLNLATGEVTAKTTGQAIIAVTLDSDEDVYDWCQITVVESATGIKISEDNLTMIVGDDPIQLTASTSSESGSTADSVVWSIVSATPEGCVSVDNGLVTANAYGTAMVVVALQDDSSLSDTCMVSVYDKIEDFELDYDESPTLILNGEDSDKSITLEASISPSTADQTVVWSVKDGGLVVSIDPTTGEVTAQSAGTATIRVTSASDSSEYDEMEVIVAEKATAIEILKDGLSVDNKSITVESTTPSITLTAEVTPDGAINGETINWTIGAGSKDNCVSVNDGTVTIAGDVYGTAYVVATLEEDSTIADTVAINVTAVITSFEIVNTDITENYIYGETSTQQLSVTILPDEADQDVVWTIKSGSDDCVTLSETTNGLLSITGVGTATIVATSASNPDKYDEITVTGTKVETADVTIGGGYTEANQLFFTYGDAAQTLTATTSPEEISYEEIITWSISGDDLIATIDPTTGEVTPVGVGEATVTATTSNGKTATCNVVVLPSISITPTTIYLDSGAQQLSVVYLPEDASTNYTASWARTGGDDCLSIASDGSATPSVAGTATVTVTLTNTNSSLNMAEGFEVTVTETHTYAVGDYYPDDVNPVGIVFSVNEAGTSGKIMSIDEGPSGYAWATESGTWFDVEGETNGRTNTAKLYTYGGNSFDMFPICKYIHETLNGGVATYADDEVGVWYLPTIGEVKEWYVSMYGWTMVYDAAEADADNKIVYWAALSALGWPDVSGEIASYTESGTEKDDYNAKVEAAGGTAFLWDGYFITTTENTKALIRNVDMSTANLNNTSKTSTEAYWRPVMAF